ncbi:hypothetical protein SDC9_71839 [bioreactor metagenome]|uniref:Uncharacterized protein n=1 Tax=bioreactor metagenome TaxID=1076179 RepID=A0A644YBL5_9ZZZZ
MIGEELLPHLHINSEVVQVLERHLNNDVWIKKKNIQQYIRIPQRIDAHKREYLSARAEFYCSTFSSHVASEYEALRVLGNRVDDSAIYIADCCANTELLIRDLEKRQRYFNSFLDSLLPADRKELTDYYLNKDGFSLKPLTNIEERAYEEIREIDEAMNYMKGIEPDFEAEQLQEIQEVAEAMDNLNLDAEGSAVVFDNTFNNIAEMLGVTF